MFVCLGLHGFPVCTQVSSYNPTVQRRAVVSLGDSEIVLCAFVCVSVRCNRLATFTGVQVKRSCYCQICYPLVLFALHERDTAPPSVEKVTFT